MADKEQTLARVLLKLCQSAAQRVHAAGEQQYFVQGELFAAGGSQI